MIDLLCPSRNRPDQAQELLDSFLSTTQLDTTNLLFLVDEDDPTKKDYPGTVLTQPSTGDPTGPLNLWALQSRADIVGFIGDDSRFETEGWDAQVENAIKTLGDGFVWANDGHEIPWPSTCFVSTKIVQALGYFALPTMRRGFFDAVWMHLAGGEFDGKWNNGTWMFGPDNLARVLPDVMIRHDNSGHPVSEDIISLDRQAYQHWVQTQMADDRRKARAAALLARFF